MLPAPPPVPLLTHPLLQEAGGTVTDVRGAPLDFSHGRSLSENRGVVATNGALHAQVLRAVAKALAL